MSTVHLTVHNEEHDKYLFIYVIRKLPNIISKFDLIIKQAVSNCYNDKIVKCVICCCCLHDTSKSRDNKKNTLN